MLLFFVDGESESCIGQSIVLGVFEQIVGEESVQFPDFKQSDAGACEQTETVVMRPRADGAHILMPQSTRNSEKIGLVADSICRAEVRQLQGVGDRVVLDGVVGCVGADVVAVTVEDVVQVVVGEVAGDMVEIQCVADGSEILSFFVFDIVIVGDL